MGLLKKTVSTRCLGQVDPQCPKFINKELLPALKNHCPECGSKVEPVQELNRPVAAVLALAVVLVVAVGIYGAYLLLAGLGSSAPAGGAGTAIPAAGPVSGGGEPGETSQAGEPVESQAQEADQAGETGLHYWIELQGGGRAGEGDTFRTGQQIRLNFKGASDGFLAVWAQSTAGSWQRLDLSPGQAAPGTPLQAGAWAATPMWLAFAEPVKDERVVIAFAPKAEALPQPPPAGSGPAAAFALPVGTERLEDADGTYLVNRAGGPVARELVLRHVPR